MASNDFIPTGRTSLIRKGDIALQVQTEYAHRPAPRITTTILKSGQVVHKIERSLDHPIDSIEDKNHMELTIRKQHMEVVAIIEDSKLSSVVAMGKTPPVKPEPTTTAERLAAIPGKHRIFILDNDGKFVDGNLSNEFKKIFAPIFKNMRELISVFALVPGVGLSREQGVCEVETNCLYLVSTGAELYFFYVERPDIKTNYEQAIKAAISGPQ